MSSTNKIDIFSVFTCPQQTNWCEQRSNDVKLDLMCRWGLKIFQQKTCLHFQTGTPTSKVAQSFCKPLPLASPTTCLIKCAACKSSDKVRFITERAPGERRTLHVCHSTIQLSVSSETRGGCFFFLSSLRAARCPQQWRHVCMPVSHPRWVYSHRALCRSSCGFLVCPSGRTAAVFPVQGIWNTKKEQVQYVRSIRDMRMIPNLKKKGLGGCLSVPPGQKRRSRFRWSVVGFSVEDRKTLQS